MRRAFKFRAYPTRPQEAGRCACSLMTATWPTLRWRSAGRRGACAGQPQHGMQSAQLRETRRADPQGQGRHSFTAQQQTVRRLNTVFAALRAREEAESGLSAVQAV